MRKTDKQYIRELEEQVADLQNQLRRWEFNGVYLEPEEKLAYLAMRDEEEETGIRRKDRELDTCIADLLADVRDDSILR